MRILVLSPQAPTPVSGNTVTLRRMVDLVGRRGHSVEITIASPGTPSCAVLRTIREFRPDLIHCYHAFKTGRWAAAGPSVVSVAGTDLNESWDQPGPRAVIETALDQTRAVLTQSPSMAQRLYEILPRLAGKVRLIPKGVTLGDRPFPLRRRAGLSGEEFVFLHPGGIRPVKNNTFAVHGLAALAAEAPQLRLVLAGPVMDTGYGEELAQRLRARPWAVALGEIPPEAMGTAYRAADVVVNTSRSEGLSNALMEAMAAGRPVLASDIAGNRDLIRDGATGLLYRGPDDFTQKARLLLHDPDLRRTLGEAARDHATRHFCAEAEVEALLRVYREALDSV